MQTVAVALERVVVQDKNKAQEGLTLDLKDY